MAQYLLLIYGREAHNDFTSDSRDERDEAIMAGHQAFGERFGPAIAAGNALRPPATATTVREGGVVTDGPWIESKEALGGYYVVEAADLDGAIEMAKAIPTDGGGVEVRPIQVFS